MNTASRRAEFFALEANEYLAELEPIAASRERTDAERLVRGARALRGAALMAGLGTFARAAAGLEALARQVRDHAVAWEPAARETWIEGLATLRSLVLRAASWEAADDRQALALAEQFDLVMHGRPARAAAPAPAALTPGVRAFIARESALIAGSFEQASRALAPVPPAAALAAVLERMQSLRGLGASAELSPLPELLDAMEVATRTLLANVPAPPNVSGVFADAAHALSAMARAVADAGQIVPPPELGSIAKRLLESYATENDVVGIATLAPDATESIVHVGTPPSDLPDADPVPVELVSVGDHLLLVAESLARPTSPAARDLKLFVLHRTLAAMPSRSATGRFLAPLATAISGAIGHRVATERPDAFVAMLRGCGRFLVDAGGMTDRVALTGRRDAIATSLVMIGQGAPAGGFEPRLAPTPTPDYVPGSEPAVTAIAVPPPGEVSPPASQSVTDAIANPSLASDDVVPIESLSPDEIVPIESLAPDDDVVPIESLAPDDDVVPIASLAPDDATAPRRRYDVPVVIPADAPGPPSRLESAFLQRRALAVAAADTTPTLGGLIGAEIVPVATLLYRGSAALSRADELRSEIAARLGRATVSLDELRPYIHELLDLVPLARDAA